MSDERPPSIPLAPKAMAAVLLLLILAHFLHAYLKLELQARGVVADHAYNLSYFVVPLILMPSLALILRGHLGVFRQFFDPRTLSLRLVVTAIAIGLLLRVAYWAQLVFRVSFGLGTETSPGETTGPSFNFDCPPLQIVGLGILTMALLVPLTEEIVHRGVIQSALARHGPLIAIALSTVTFALLHKPSGILPAMFGGAVLGALFWKSHVLWAPVIAHATYNFVVLFDWYCANIVWWPSDESLPLVRTGLSAAILLIAGLILCAFLLYRIGPRRFERPGQPD